MFTKFFNKLHKAPTMFLRGSCHSTVVISRIIFDFPYYTHLLPNRVIFQSYPFAFILLHVLCVCFSLDEFFFRFMQSNLIAILLCNGR
jgi:hypothetical protein